MNLLIDYKKREIRFTDERISHIQSDHTELSDQLEKIHETVLTPDLVMQSKTDENVDLLYKFYEKTPVTKKYMCVLVKYNKNDYFVITAYFTDTVKKGQLKWQKT